MYFIGSAHQSNVQVQRTWGLMCDRLLKDHVQRLGEWMHKSIKIRDVVIRWQCQCSVISMRNILCQPSQIHFKIFCRFAAIAWGYLGSFSLTSL